MDTSKIVQLRASRDTFKKLPREEHYRFQHVDISNYSEYIEDLQQVINYLHQQLEWDGIPTVEELVKRFEAESFCLLLYYNDNCIGWNWANPNVRLDWIKLEKTLDSNGAYLGGVFVTNVVDRPANAGLINYNMYFEYMYELGYKYVYGYVDDWNKAALRVNHINGARAYNFLD